MSAVEDIILKAFKVKSDFQASMRAIGPRYGAITLVNQRNHSFVDRPAIHKETTRKMKYNWQSFRLLIIHIIAISCVVAKLPSCRVF
jgi:hypothetical protein